MPKTANTPTPIPASNISPTNSHEENNMVKLIKNRKSRFFEEVRIFMFKVFL